VQHVLGVGIAAEHAPCDRQQHAAVAAMTATASAWHSVSGRHGVDVDRLQRPERRDRFEDVCRRARRGGGAAQRRLDASSAGGQRILNR